MKIIVGLGNPGRQYELTPHNLGFEVVDEIARRFGLSWSLSPNDHAAIAEGRIGREKVLLAKPNTMMNLSGKSVNALMRNRPAELADVLVIVDDVNLAAGRLRIRSSGSHGSHNGLRSIIQTGGGEGFPRLRVGIRPPGQIRDLASYVLSRPAPEIRSVLAQSTLDAADCAEFWVEHGDIEAANRFNGKD